MRYMHQSEKKGRRPGTYDQKIAMGLLVERQGPQDQATAHTEWLPIGA